LTHYYLLVLKAVDVVPNDVCASVWMVDLPVVLVGVVQLLLGRNYYYIIEINKTFILTCMHIVRILKFYIGIAD